MTRIALIFSIESSIKAITQGLQDTIEYSEEWFYLKGKRSAYQEVLNTLERSEEKQNEVSSTRHR